MIEIFLINGLPHTEGPFGLEPMSTWEYQEAVESYAAVVKEAVLS